MGIILFLIVVCSLAFVDYRDGVWVSSEEVIYLQGA